MFFHLPSYMSLIFCCGGFVMCPVCSLVSFFVFCFVTMYVCKIACLDQPAGGNMSSDDLPSPECNTTFVAAVIESPSIQLQWDPVNTSDSWCQDNVTYCVSYRCCNDANWKQTSCTQHTSIKFQVNLEGCEVENQAVFSVQVEGSECIDNLTVNLDNNTGIQKVLYHQVSRISFMPSRVSYVTLLRSMFFVFWFILHLQSSLLIKWAQSFRLKPKAALVTLLVNFALLLMDQIQFVTRKKFHRRLTTILSLFAKKGHAL